MAKNLGGAFAAFLSIDTLKNHLQGLFESGNKIEDLSEQFDMSTDSVQHWEKAVGRAHLTAQTFYRAMDALRSKRQGAREDDKNMAPFTALGISEDDVRGNMSDEDLLKRVLTSSGTRAQQGDIIGMRGTKLKAALQYLNPSGDVAFTTEDIASLHEAEQAGKEASSMWQKYSMKSGPGRAMMAVTSLFKGDLKNALKNWAKVGTFYGALDRDTTAKPPPETPAEPELDADLEWKRRTKELEGQKKLADELMREFDAKQKIHEIDRQNMPSHQKRLDLEKSRLEIFQKISEIQHYEDPNLRGAMAEQLHALGNRWTQIGNELSEKPYDVKPDALAQIGLFTGATAAFSPLLNVQQEQVNILRRIEKNTSQTRGGDPFEP